VALAAPALALIGALALACFVKVFGAVFLGNARSEHARAAHESPATMTGSMLVLVICCAAIGLMPWLVAPVFDQAIAAWAPDARGLAPLLATAAPLAWISVMGVLLLAGLTATGMVLWLRLGRSVVDVGPTWGCGYVAPTPRMQYTSSSFGQVLVFLFDWALRPRTQKPAGLALFPTRTSFHSEVPDPVLDEAVLPAFRFGGWAFSWFRVVQQGSIQTYLLYIMVALIVLLLWR
jgi:hydrogenase-4 component B